MTNVGTDQQAKDKRLVLRLQGGAVQGWTQGYGGEGGVATQAPREQHRRKCEVVDWDTLNVWPRRLLFKLLAPGSQ